MNTQNNQPQTESQAEAGIDLDSDAPMTPACPLNRGDGETCEACQ